MTQEGFKRKLTAILSADVVGYSRLMEEDDIAAVMPFNNMSGDPAQEYIGDGISENIITALSVGSGMFVSEGKLAIELDPNFSIGHAHLARTMFFLGRFAEATELMKKAMRLSPYYPAFYLIYLGRSYAFLGRYEEAMDAFNQLIDLGRKGECPADWGLIHWAEVYAQPGREDEARTLMTQVLDIKPGLSS